MDAAVVTSPAAKVKNRLLRLAPPHELRRLMSAFEEVAIRPRQVLHHFGLPMNWVYFVESGLASVAAKIGPSKFVEVWLIGSEGMIGSPLVLADDRSPPHRRVVQVGGKALRASVQEFQSVLPHVPGFRAVLERYVYTVLLQTSQVGACNAHHQLPQRMARWLLLARNALASDEVPLTHEVLARLLGVRRASVTECLQALQKEGVLQTGRGAIVIPDPSGLEQTCCDCFRLIMHEYQRHFHVP